MILRWIHALDWATLMPVAGVLLFLGWESVRPFFPFFRGSARLRGQHLARNVAIALLNDVMIGLCFLPLWSRVAFTHIGLLNVWSLPVWLYTLFAILLLDCWTYWWHRANHEIKFLWRFHRMHHSDPYMDVTTARRLHPGEIIFSSLLRLPLMFVLGIHLRELLLYGVVMGLVVDFHHANIALPERIDRILRILIPTPAMHKVHHSRIQLETDSNYSSLLSVWDRLFGSFRLRPDQATIAIGLDKWSDDPRSQTIRSLLKAPFRREEKFD